MARNMSLATTEVYAVKVVRHRVHNGETHTYTDILGPYQTLGAAKAQGTANSHAPWYNEDDTIDVTLYKATVEWEDLRITKEPQHG